ncbi:hypothetical protein [Mesorhizobium sp. M0586]|uniref:hypothetical protein n=1 Tax=unclassified Mesorhizobium TaxID=325217 RepID=UPI000416A2D2
MPRRRRKSKDPLTKIKNSIRGADNKVVAFLEKGRNADLSVLDPLARWSFSWLPTLGVLGRLTPKRLADLSANAPLRSIGLSRDIEWATAAILREAEAIERYLQRKGDFDRLLNRSSLAEAIEQLDRLDEQVGQSFQSLSTRIALTQLSEGLEAQKDLVSGLRKNSASPMALFYTFWWSVLAEDGTSAEHFAKEIRRRMDSWEVDAEARAHISYFLLKEYPSEGGESNLLTAATSSGVIDTYEMLIGIATVAAAEKRSTANLFKRAMSRIATRISDERVTKILLLCGSLDSAAKLSRKSTTYLDARLSGIGNAQQGSAESLEELNAAVLQGIARTPSNELVSKLEGALRAIDQPGDEGARASIALWKLGLMLGHTSVGRWATSVAQAYAPRANPFDPSFDGARFVAASDGLLEAFSALTAECAAAFALQIEKIYGPSPVAAAARILVGQPIAEAALANLSKATQMSLALQRAVLQKDADAVLDAASQMLQLSRTREALFFREGALLELGRVRDALSNAVELLVSDPLYITWLPVRDLIRLVYRNDQNEFAGDIETPILFDFASKHVDQELSSYVSYTAEDFILTKDADRPSRVEWQLSTGDDALLVHFLAEVCTPATLRLFTAFESERELEEERIAICQLLSRLDSNRRGKYEDEARSIVTSRLVKEAIKQLQASKISIDEDAIRVWGTRNLREDFARYQSLYASGLVVVDQAYREALLQALESGEISQSLYDVPQNEAGALFTQIVVQFVRECAFDPEHGLDCYLSLRIRHGTFSGVMRSAPEMERVVTRRATETGDYRENSFWRTATADQLDDDAWQLTQDRLSKFSGDFDGLVREITNDYIQVKREEKPKGLFNVDINPISIYGLATEIDDETSFDEMLTRTLVIFWGLVERSLNEVREFLDGDARLRFRSLFNNLEIDLRWEPALAPLADAVIRARNDVELSLDRVRDWFELPTATATLTFTLNQLIEVALEAIKSFHRDFLPTLVMPADDIPQLIGALNLFSDMFFVVLENIYTHCGSSSPDVRITAVMGDRSLSIRVENSMVAERCGAENVERVARSRERIATGGYLSDVNREGGTGLPKLAKLVGYKSGQGELDFALDCDARIFWLEFSLPARIFGMSDEVDDEQVASD